MQKIFERFTLKRWVLVAVAGFVLVFLFGFLRSFLISISFKAGEVMSVGVFTQSLTTLTGMFRIVIFLFIAILAIMCGVTYQLKNLNLAGYIKSLLVPLLCTLFFFLFLGVFKSISAEIMRGSFIHGVVRGRDPLWLVVLCLFPLLTSAFLNLIISIISYFQTKTTKSLL